MYIFDLTLTTLCGQSYIITLPFQKNNYIWVMLCQEVPLLRPKLLHCYINSGLLTIASQNALKQSKIQV